MLHPRFSKTACRALEACSWTYTPSDRPHRSLLHALLLPTPLTGSPCIPNHGALSFQGLFAAATPLLSSVTPTACRSRPARKPHLHARLCLRNPGSSTRPHRPRATVNTGWPNSNFSSPAQSASLGLPSFQQSWPKSPGAVPESSFSHDPRPMVKVKSLALP